MANTVWCITQKPDFLQAMLALPPKEVHQIFTLIAGRLPTTRLCWRMVLRAEEVHILFVLFQFTFNDRLFPDHLARKTTQDCP